MLPLQQRGVNLSSVRTCIVVAEERPRMQLMSSFTKVFATLGLSPRAVSTTFGCRVNTAMCLQVFEFIMVSCNAFLTPSEVFLRI